MRIVLFEDQRTEQLSPVALMRPVFELRCGQHTLRERLADWNLLSEWSAIVRPWLAERHREQHPDVPVNDFAALQEESTLLVNGRFLPNADALSQATLDNVGVVDGQVMFVLLDPAEAILLTEEEFDAGLERIAQSRSAIEADGAVINYPWDLVSRNAAQIVADFKPAETVEPELAEGVVVLGDTSQVNIADNALIDPFVVLDARHGPITIASEAHIQSFTRIEGPAFIGERSQLFRALIREGTTIGPVCRVGGEIEEAIFHGYVNKYHEGFIGHGYICPWVNLGALTTNSDLKNDYTNVSVPLSGKSVNSGGMKVGCFIGDHTKTGLGSLFNTGSAIGVFSMVLPGGELLPKYIPSFSRVWHGELADGWELDRMLEIAKAAMARRNVEMTSAEERLVRYLAKHTQAHRGRAIHRDQRKRQEARENPSPQHWT